MKPQAVATATVVCLCLFAALAQGQESAFEKDFQLYVDTMPFQVRDYLYLDVVARIATNKEPKNSKELVQALGQVADKWHYDKFAANMGIEKIPNQPYHKALFALAIAHDTATNKVDAVGAWLDMAKIIKDDRNTGIPAASAHIRKYISVFYPSSNLASSIGFPRLP